MKNTSRYQTGLLIGLMFALALLLFPTGRLPVRAEEVAYIASVGSAQYTTLTEAVSHWKNQDGSTLTLLGDASTEGVEITNTLTLDLNGHNLTGASNSRIFRIAKGASLILQDSSVSGTVGALKGGAGAVSVNPNGKFIMTGGQIIENSAENGGGVSVAQSAEFDMRGGTITNNTARGGRGGGVFVEAGGRMTLSGNAQIMGNKTTDYAESNLYLSGMMTVTQGFSGRAGISMEEIGDFALSASKQNFFADDKTYEVAEINGNCSLKLSPLKSITVKNGYSASIYPTTALETIKNALVVNAINQNGVAYGKAPKVEIEGELTPGECELLVSAEGSDSDVVTATLFVRVEVPTLVAITPVYEQTATVYFNSEITLLHADLTVNGEYSDGKTRVICQTAEETSALCGESYIQDAYELSGDFSKRVEGVSRVNVKAGVKTAKFDVAVSRYKLSASDVQTATVTVTQKSGAWNVDYGQFAPDLPKGIEVRCTLNGDALSANQLQAGEYFVTLSFTVTDTENYEDITDTATAVLIVCHRSLAGTLNGVEAEHSFASERGIPPSWAFDMVAVEPNIKLEGDVAIGEAVEITLKEDGYAKACDRTVTVRYKLSETLLEKELAVYRVLSDGTALEISSYRDGDYIVFETEEFSKTQYIVAYKADNAVYLGLTALFGVVCVASAGLLLWYFAVRRKMRIR